MGDLPIQRRLLRTIRLLRFGTTDLATADDDVRSLIGASLAGTCRTLARWCDEAVPDRRAADAFVRAYGLGQLPETRAAIAAGLRNRRGGIGLSEAAVDGLIAKVDRQLARDLPDLRLARRVWGLPTPLRWCDPFPGGVAAPPAERGRLRRAWGLAQADLPAHPSHDADRALRLYGAEHGIAPPAEVPVHREERRRLRRLAWSLMTVAAERDVAKEPDDVIVDRLLGARFQARTPGPIPGSAAAVGAIDPLDDVGLEQLLEVAGAAVRAGRPEAAELLALVRDAAARRRHPVPPTITSRILALHAIVAREGGSPGGVVAGREVLGLALQQLDGLHGRPLDPLRSPTVAAVVNDALRGVQESAELLDALGHHAAALSTLRQMPRLYAAGDPDGHREPHGWEQQYQQSLASLARHAGAASGRWRIWLPVAAAAADRSHQLVERHGLDVGYGMAANAQRLSVQIVRIAHTDPGPSRTRRLRSARASVQAAAIGLDGPAPTDRPGRNARAGLARRAWQLALLGGDPDEVLSARAAALDGAGPWTLRPERDKLVALEAATRALGAPPDPRAELAGRPAPASGARAVTDLG